RIYLFFQSLDQLRKCYGENAPTVLDNLQTQLYFGINSLDTADHLSKRIGDATIVIETINQNISRSRPSGYASQGEGGSTSSSSGSTLSEAARRLLKPEEVLVLPHRVGLLFHKNLPCIPVWMPPYFADKAFKDGGTGQARKPG